MTWNVDGFNTVDRRLEIVSYLWKKGVDIAILTESHLKDEDIYTDPGDGKERVMLIKLDHYNITHWHNRESELNWRCGGVLILTRAGIDCTLVPQDVLPSRPLSCCSLIVTAIGGCCQPFRLTGIYLPPPPTARVKPRDLAPLLKDHPHCYWTGQRLTHIICGDLNPPSWREGFEEWLGEMGVWELSDPTIPTYPRGDALDRFLLIPGDEHWEALLPDPMNQVDGDEKSEMHNEHYPAVVLPPHPLSAHHPVYLDLPFVEEPTQPRVRTLMVDSLSPEDWSERDARAVELLKEGNEAFEDACRRRDINRMYEHIMGVIKAVLSDCFSRGTKDPAKRDPVEMFCRRNAAHPKTKYLKMAEQVGDRATFCRLVKEISGDGWKAFLNKMRVSSLSKLFRFIARRDGRAKAGGTLSCASPLIQDTIYHYGGAAKVELLASYFGKRLTADPDVPYRWTHHMKYLEETRRNTPTTQLDPVTVLEV